MYTTVRSSCVIRRWNELARKYAPAQVIVQHHRQKNPQEMDNLDPSQVTHVVVDISHCK